MPLRKTLALVIALAMTSITASQANAADGQAPHVPGEIVVKFAPQSAPSERVGALSAVGAESSAPIGLPRTRVVDLSGEGGDMERLSKAFSRRPAVLWAEPNYIYTSSSLPNDPSFVDGSLWGLRNTGQTVPQDLDRDNRSVDRAGTPGIDIGAVDAWRQTTGSREVLVGVVDSGVNTHPDLNANLRLDLARDFRAESGSQFDASIDADGHGTHVAGTIGAVGNNSRGVTGVNWRVGIVGLRVLDGGGGTSANIAAAFAYAGQLGLPVVNASIGGGESRVMSDAIRLSTGTLFVVAAGNDSENHDLPGSDGSFPCDFPHRNLICVAAIGNVGDLSWFSDYGVRSVDLGAPGSAILSTSPSLEPAIEFEIDGATFDENWDTGEGDEAWSVGEMTIGGAPEPALASPAVEPGVDLDTFVTSEPFVGELTDRKGCTLHGIVSLEGDDAEGDPAAILAIETSVNGFTWKSIRTLRGTTSPSRLSHGIQADGASFLMVRARMAAVGDDVDEPQDGARIARLRVECLSETDPGGYATHSGTSMASPHVAGAAALLLAKRPDLSVAALREAILTTVTPLVSLQGRTVTGGMLNLAAAMKAIEVVPEPEPVVRELRARMRPGSPSLRRNRGVAVRIVASEQASVLARAVIRWRPTRITHGERRVRLRGGRVPVTRLRGGPADRSIPRSRMIPARNAVTLRLTPNRGQLRRLLRLQRLGVRLSTTVAARAFAPEHTPTARMIRGFRLR